MLKLGGVSGAGQNNCADLGADVVSACSAFQSEVQPYQGNVNDNATITREIQASSTRITSE